MKKGMFFYLILTVSLTSCKTETSEKKEIVKTDSIISTKKTESVPVQEVEENKVKDTSKVVDFKSFKVVFKEFNSEFNLWYKPYLVVGTDTTAIEGVPLENGSELFINKSPDGNYFVLDNIIKGFVDDENGNKSIHENFTCLIVNVKSSKVMETLQSQCDAEWNENNELISGGQVVFSSKK